MTTPNDKTSEEELGEERAPPPPAEHDSHERLSWPHRQGSRRLVLGTKG